MTSSAQTLGGRREEILQAAKRLFAEQGYRETNLNDLATLLGFKRQAIYHYFASKDEILFELVGRAGKAVELALASVGADLPPLDVLREFVRVHVRQVLGDADVFRIQFDVVPKLQGERGDELRQAQEDYVRRLVDVLASGQKEGVFVPMPPMPMALMIIGMCNSLVYWYHASSEGLSIDEMADHVATLVTTGVRPTE